jgi:hypothetical protein
MARCFVDLRKSENCCAAVIDSTTALWFASIVLIKGGNRVQIAACWLRMARAYGNIERRNY